MFCMASSKKEVSGADSIEANKHLKKAEIDRARCSAFLMPSDAFSLNLSRFIIIVSARISWYMSMEERLNPLPRDWYWNVEIIF